MLKLLEQLGAQAFTVALEINPHHPGHMSLADYITTLDLGEDTIGAFDMSRDELYQLSVWTTAVGHYTWLGQDLNRVVTEAALHFGLTLPA